VFLLLASRARAQGAGRSSPYDSPEFHDRVVAVLRQFATRPLPPGDTLVLFNPEPVLFYTAGYGSDVTRSAMLRGDGLIGTQETRWANGLVSSFSTLWTRGDSTVRRVRGTVDGRRLRLTSARDMVLALPSLPWGVADYSLEEQLAPIFLALRPQPTPQRVAVFRPFLSKWDTVSVEVRAVAGGKARLVRTANGKMRETLLFDERGRLLLARRLDIVGERRPLVGSERDLELKALLSAVPELR
jgi:hypothetical protein